MKYIDAEKLKSLIRERYNIYKIGQHSPFRNGKVETLRETIELIDSLQQEQSKDSKGKFVFPKFLYARTLDNKTIDVSYGPQDMTAIEYVRNDFVEQVQPEVDLEKEYKEWWENKVSGNVNIKHTMEWYMHETARHFYLLGLNARKEE